MEKFGLSGLWTHMGSTLVAVALVVADALLNYLNVVQMPNWAHAVVGVAALALAAYRGKAALPPVK